MAKAERKISRRKERSARGIQDFMSMTIEAFGTYPSPAPNPESCFVCGRGKGASEFVS